MPGIKSGIDYTRKSSTNKAYPTSSLSEQSFGCYASFAYACMDLSTVSPIMPMTSSTRPTPFLLSRPEDSCFSFISLLLYSHLWSVILLIKKAIESNSYSLVNFSFFSVWLLLWYLFTCILIRFIICLFSWLLLEFITLFSVVCFSRVYLFLLIRTSWELL